MKPVWGATSHLLFSQIQISRWENNAARNESGEGALAKPGLDLELWVMGIDFLLQAGLEF